MDIIRAIFKTNRETGQPRDVEWQKPFFVVGEDVEALQYLTKILNKHSKIALTCQSGLPSFFKYTNVVRNLQNLQRFDDGKMQFIGLIPDENRQLFDELYESGSEELRREFYCSFFGGKLFTRYGEALSDYVVLPDLSANFPEACWIHLLPQAGKGSGRYSLLSEHLEKQSAVLKIDYKNLFSDTRNGINKILKFLSLSEENSMFSENSPSPVELKDSRVRRGSQTISQFPTILSSRIQHNSQASIHWETPVFLVSVGRSGSTHLTEILNAHPDAAITSESYLTHIFQMMDYLAETPANKLFQRGPLKIEPQVTEANQKTFSKLNRQLMTELNRQFYLLKFQGKNFRRWGDKFQAPFAVPEILKAYPKAQFVFLVRDGRDRTVSVMKFHKRLRENNPHVPAHSFEDQCNIWKNSNLRLRNLLKDHPHTYFMHYEKLIETPHPEVRKLLNFLNLPESGEVFNYIDKSTTALFTKHGTSAGPKASIGRWKTEMSDENKDVARRIMGETLEKFGYTL